MILLRGKGTKLGTILSDDRFNRVLLKETNHVHIRNQNLHNL